MISNKFLLTTPIFFFSSFLLLPFFLLFFFHFLLSFSSFKALHPLSKCAPDIAWQTPLHVACSKGHTAVVQILLDAITHENFTYGVQKKMKKNNNNNLNQINKQKEDKKNISTHQSAILSNHSNWRSSTRDTPIHLAAALDHVSVVKLLLKHRPSIFIGYRNSAGWSEHGLAMKKSKKLIEKSRPNSALGSKDIFCKDPDTCFEFVAVFSMKYINDLKNVVEGLTHASEETPNCELRCEGKLHQKKE